jgi:hypothetical protein
MPGIRQINVGYWGLLYDSPGRSFPWIGYTDYATGDPGSSVADRLTPIIWFRVDDYCTSEDRVLLSLNGNVAHGDFIMGFAFAVCLDVAKVAGMTLLGVGQTVLVAFGVIMPASAHCVGRCAISVLMNVESVLLVWCQSFKVGYHFHGVAVLGKVNDAMTVLTRCRVQHHHGLRNGAVGATHGKG